MSEEKLPGEDICATDSHFVPWVTKNFTCESLGHCLVRLMTYDELREFARECFEAGSKEDSIDGLPFFEYAKSRGLRWVTYET